MSANVSRRELLVYGSIFGWLPFFRRKQIELAGARFRIVRNGHSKRHYLLIHGDEETARSVLTRHIQVHQGTAFIVQGHTRNVPIDSGQIDPNRMFSRVGAEANLKHLNPDWTAERVDAALALLDRDREKLVKELFPPQGGLLIALHNNSENYSAANEESINDAVSMSERANPHDFFLCTSPDDFKVLSTSPYNVLLQNKAPQTDDGSLSRLAAAKGVRYVNIEVSMGQSGRQQEMLSWLEWRLT